jgi:carbonic anhydrase
MPAYAGRHVNDVAAISPEAALSRMLEGNNRYLLNAGHHRDDQALRAELVAGQRPIAAVVGCADSRVIPEQVFDQGPGDIFVVRVAGNFVNVDGLASLEYAVQFLDVPLIMVLGHTGCGAIQAAVRASVQGELPGHMSRLVQALSPAVELARAQGDANLEARAELKNVHLNVNRLRSAVSLVLNQRLHEGKLRVVGALYDLATGRVRLV